MAVHVDALTPDSQAIALLCTTLALPRGQKPLNASEWNSLATTIRQANLRPGDLLPMSLGEMKEALDLPTASISRMVDLLRRGGQLAFELERLSSRGITLITRADAGYPQLYKERLRQQAPPALYAAGDATLLSMKSGAVVGSRDADEDTLEFASALGRRLAIDRNAVVSGGARGVDSTAMTAALDAGGVAIGVVADSLEKAVRRLDFRSYIADGTLVLLSPYHPNARFSVGGAMGRNRLIYCLADCAFVVAAGEKGGTIQGANENLKARWVPLLVRAERGAPPANARLLNDGALPFTREDLDGPDLLARLKGIQSSGQLSVDAEDLHLPKPKRDNNSPGSLAAENEHTEGGRGATAAETSSDLHVSIAPASDAFSLVWPTLADYLRTARSPADVRLFLNIELSQARAWLSRGVAEGRLRQLERPRRYETVSEVVPPLFET
jgi:predicted Rossmann fold nucleotide-binding protein DprA/Smf involved in DNA uptake